MENNHTEEDLEEIKIRKPLSKNQKRAIFISVIVAVAGFVGIFLILEINRLQKRLILATTTSTYDSGLLDYLLPIFEEQSGITIEIISVGTGQAIEIGQNGDADVLLVHSRTREDEFIDDEYGLHRVCVMYNDFIIVGPVADPANINGENVSETMTRLKNAGELGTIEFYSRGDESGTHSKELALWSEIGFTPDSETDTWYLETGAGMGDTLTITDENDGYTLVDRGTWLSARDKLDLILLVEGGEILLNPYGAMVINPDKNTGIKYKKAIVFIAFLVSEEGQDLIGDYKKDGEVLFHPCFGICDETHSCPTTDEEVEFWKEYNGGYTGP